MTTNAHDAAADDFCANDLLAVTADDAGMREGLRDILVEEAPRMLTRMDAGLAAASAVLVADAAHAVKSLVATVGGRRAFALADALERRARQGDTSDARQGADALAASIGKLTADLTAFIERERRTC